MRSSGSLRGIDRSVGQWGADHATHWSTQGLQYVTDLASTTAAIAVVVVVGIVELARTRNRWVLPFLVSVLLGEVLLVNTIKHVLDRVRPTFNPIAAHLGPSFPSGHSATAAAFYAAAALIIGRAMSRTARQLVIAAAVAIAVAVAGTRVLLDLHWFSDVIGGLSLGWAWFALCAVAFGGRLLRPTAAVEIASAEASAPKRAPPSVRSQQSEFSRR
jgi:undecaprenyl-diphosphatase